MNVAGPGRGPRVAPRARDTGPDVVPVLTDLSRWRNGAPPVEADPVESLLSGSRLSSGVSAAVRAIHPAPVVPAEDDGRTFTPARVPSSLGADAPLDVETRAVIMHVLRLEKDLDPVADLLSSDDPQHVFTAERTGNSGLAAIARCSSSRDCQPPDGPTWRRSIEVRSGVRSFGLVRQRSE